MFRHSNLENNFKSTIGRGVRRFFDVAHARRKRSETIVIISETSLITDQRPLSSSKIPYEIPPCRTHPFFDRYILVYLLHRRNLRSDSLRDHWDRRLFCDKTPEKRVGEVKDYN